MHQIFFKFSVVFPNNVRQTGKNHLNKTQHDNKRKTISADHHEE